MAVRLGQTNRSAGNKTYLLEVMAERLKEQPEMSALYQVYASSEEERESGEMTRFRVLPI